MKEYVDQAIRIADLLTVEDLDAGRAELRDARFDACSIYGPALLWPGPDFELSHSTSLVEGGDHRSILWPPPQGARRWGGMIGSLFLINVSFVGCRFRHIGWVAPPGIKRLLLEGMERP